MNRNLEILEITNLFFALCKRTTEEEIILIDK